MKTIRKSKVLASALSILILATQCVLVHAQEANLWTLRRPIIQNIPKSLSSNLPQLTDSRIKKWVKDNSSERLKEVLRALSSQYGSIRNVISSSSEGPIVVHIQDVHMNHEAQKNIGDAVQRLIDFDQVDLVALEGAFRPIDISDLRGFPHKETIQNVADHFLKKNEISGSIHAAFTSSKEIPAIVGVDDPVHYEANVEAYRRSSRLKIQKSNEIQSLKSQTQNAKRNIFNGKLLEFDSVVQQYRDGDISLGNYVQVLSNYSDSLPLSVDIFLEALEIETSLNFGQVEHERTLLIGELLKKMNQTQTKHLMNLSVSFRMGKVNHADFYQYLKDLCKKNQVNLTQYKEMDRYLQYILLSDAIDGEKLTNELRDLEASIYNQLTKTSSERLLIKESRQIYLKQKLIDFSLTKNEWDEYKNFKLPEAPEEQFPSLQGGARGGYALSLPLLKEAGERKEGATVDLLKKEKKINAQPWPFPGGKGTNHRLGSFEGFYQEAEERDESISKNLMAAVAERKIKVAILVTGGFHSKGIHKNLKDSNTTIISYTPKITKINTSKGSDYLSIFTQEKTPLEKLFEGQKLFLASDPYSIASYRKITSVFVSEGFKKSLASIAYLRNLFRKALGWSHVELTKTTDGKVLISGKPKEYDKTVALTVNRYEIESMSLLSLPRKWFKTEEDWKKWNERYEKIGAPTWESPTLTAVAASIPWVTTILFVFFVHKAKALTAFDVLFDGWLLFTLLMATWGTWVADFLFKKLHNWIGKEVGNAPKVTHWISFFFSTITGGILYRLALGGVIQLNLYELLGAMTAMYILIHTAIHLYHNMIHESVKRMSLDGLQKKRDTKARVYKGSKRYEISWEKNAGSENGLEDFPVGLQNVLRDKKTFSERVVAIYFYLNWADSDLSAKSGVNGETIKAIRDKPQHIPKIDVTFKLAKALNTSVIFLLTGKPESQAFKGLNAKQRIELILHRDQVSKPALAKKANQQEKTLRKNLQLGSKTDVQLSRRLIFLYANALDVPPSLIERGVVNGSGKPIHEVVLTQPPYQKVFRVDQKHLTTLSKRLLDNLIYHWSKPEISLEEDFEDHIFGGTGESQSSLTERFYKASREQLDRLVYYGFLSTELADRFHQGKKLSDSLMEDFSDRLLSEREKLLEFFEEMPGLKPPQPSFDVLLSVWHLLGRGYTRDRLVAILDNTDTEISRIRSLLQSVGDPEAKIISRNLKPKKTAENKESLYALENGWLPIGLNERSPEVRRNGLKDEIESKVRLILKTLEEEPKIAQGSFPERQLNTAKWPFDGIVNQQIPAIDFILRLDATLQEVIIDSNARWNLLRVSLVGAAPDDLSNFDTFAAGLATHWGQSQKNDDDNIDRLVDQLYREKDPVVLESLANLGAMHDKDGVLEEAIIERMETTDNPELELKLIEALALLGFLQETTLETLVDRWSEAQEPLRKSIVKVLATNGPRSVVALPALLKTKSFSRGEFFSKYLIEKIFSKENNDLRLMWEYLIDGVVPELSNSDLKGEMEAYIFRALAISRGNKAAAARALSVTSGYISNLQNRYKIPKKNDVEKYVHEKFSLTQHDLDLLTAEDIIPLAEFRNRRILFALIQKDGSALEAAKLLGYSQNAFYGLLRREFKDLSKLKKQSGKKVIQQNLVVDFARNHLVKKMSQMRPNDIERNIFRMFRIILMKSNLGTSVCQEKSLWNQVHQKTCLEFMISWKSIAVDQQTLQWKELGLSREHLKPKFGLY